MSKGIDESPDIQPIFDKPGREWTDAERRRVWEWLWEERQYHYFVKFILYHLGYGTTRDEAEDAWMQFQPVLFLLFDMYDPAKGRRFWNFVLNRLSYFCLDQNKRHWKDVARSGPFPTRNDEGDGEKVEIEFPEEDPDSNPEAATENKLRLLALQNCINALPAKHRSVIVLHYYEEKPVAVIAATLRISEQNARTRLCRARQMLGNCLHGGGQIQ